MAKRGVSTRSEALDFDDFRRLIDSLHSDEEYRRELFCVLSYNFALRISDVLNLTWEDLLGIDYCRVIEIKTSKECRIPLEPSVRNRILDAHSLMGVSDNTEKVFRNPETGNPITSTQPHSLSTMQ